jgi:hypothetical protein
MLALLALGFVSSAGAALSAVELAKLAQNPIANLISVPFQNNTNFDFAWMAPRTSSTSSPSSRLCRPSAGI